MTTTKSRVVAALAASFALTGTAASAQDMGDPANGAAIARSICAECHAVDVAQTRSPNAKAPRFATVAKTPGMTPTALRVWLQSPHPTMPNLILSEPQKDDVIAYLLSLKNK